MSVLPTSHSLSSSSSSNPISPPFSCMAQFLCLSKGGYGVIGVDGAVDSPLPFNSADPDTSEDEDEDRFFAGLTRRLAQSKSFAGVPSRRLDALPYLIEEDHEVKSTFAGTTNCLTPMDGSQFRVPLGSETERFDLAIRAAALELANLKMAPQVHHQHLGTGYSGKQASPIPLPPDQYRLPWTQNANHDPFSLLVAPSTLQRRHAGEGEVTNQPHEALMMGQQRRGQQQIRSQIGKSGLLAEGSRFGRTHSFPEPGWASKVVPYGNGPVPKRGCAGTGVFLPRGYGDVALESRRKSVCSTPTVIVPAKVALALNMNFQLQDHSGLLLARRNAILMQQRRLRPDGSLNHNEPSLLPQEWTY